MPTMKKRMNISLPKDVNAAIGKLALRDDLPPATKAIDLIKIALEIEEDQIWDSLASSRDKKSATFIMHDQVWS
jgi:hypothetical protein